MAASIAELEAAAKDVIREARLNDAVFLSLTHGTARQKIEQHLDLEPGTLSAVEYKRPLRRIIDTIMEAASDEAEKSNKEKDTEGPSNKHVNSQKTKRQDKTEPGKLPSVAKRKRGDGSKEYKSAALILSSDAEDEDETKPSTSNMAVSVQNISENKLTLDTSKYNLSSQKREKANHVNDKATSPTPSALKDEGDSTSDKSTLIDKQVFKRRKKHKIGNTDSSKAKNLADPDKGRKSTQELSKDDVTIKRLKSFIVACGVRKVWSKVFEHDDTPSQQIKKLKGILTELGMTGRISLEKAKQIKEQRELAKELVDVQSFEQSVLSRSLHGQRASKPDGQEVESESDEVRPTRRRRTALSSITAFLDDQSDE